MRTGRQLRRGCDFFLAASLAALFLTKEGTARETVAPTEGGPTTQSAPLPEAPAADPERIFSEALPAVFLVETETWKGLGFLADGSGLIVTASFAEVPIHYLAVTLAPGRKVAAQLLQASWSRYGVIRVDPGVVAGIRPLIIAPPPGGANPEAEGSPLVGIFLSPEGGFVRQNGTITKGGIPCPHADLPLPADPGSCFWSPNCFCWPVQCASGVVLDAQGRVLGLNPFKDNKHKPHTRVLRIQNAGEMLSAARTEAQKIAPPLPTLLPTPPPDTRPEETPVRLSESRPDPALYRIQAGPYLVEFLTPSLARVGAEGTEKKRTAPGEKSCSQPKGTQGRWRPSFTDKSPVVTLRVVPEIHRRGGTYFGVTVFWIFSPVIYTASILGGSTPSPPPHVSSRFEPPIREIELLRGGTRVEPIRPERVCGFSRRLLDIDLCPAESGLQEKRRVKGCYLNYIYPADAFNSCEPMELRIYREDATDSQPTVVFLSKELLQWIQADLGPFSRSAEGIEAPAASAAVPDSSTEDPP